MPDASARDEITVAAIQTKIVIAKKTLWRFIVSSSPVLLDRFKSRLKACENPLFENRKGWASLPIGTPTFEES